MRSPCLALLTAALLTGAPAVAKETTRSKAKRAVSTTPAVDVAPLVAEPEPVLQQSAQVRSLETVDTDRAVTQEAAPPVNQPEAAPVKRLSLRVLAGGLLSNGLTQTHASATEGLSSGNRGVTFAAAAGVTYALPVLESRLAAQFEAGIYPMSGSGSRDFANDPDFGPTLRWTYAMRVIPLSAGLRFALPLSLPFELAASASFVYAQVTTVTRWTPEGKPTVEAAPQSGWAPGFGLGFEAAIPVGPGALLASLRYLNARTDLDFQRIYRGDFNSQPGDVAGAALLVGYQYSF